MKVRLVTGLLFVACIGFAQTPQPPQKPLSKDEILDLVRSEVLARRIVDLIRQRGIDFEPTGDVIGELKSANADDLVIEAVRAARQPPASIQAQERLTRAKEFWKRKAYSQAEEEYRAAILLTPADVDARIALGDVLRDQQRWNEAIVEYRAVVNLVPDLSIGHNRLALALDARAQDERAFGFENEDGKRDRQLALEEHGTAYQLRPEDETFRSNYELALSKFYPSIIIDPGAKLPTTWSDTWRFYIDGGKLTIANGRLKRESRNKKLSFDVPLSEVEEVRLSDTIWQEQELIILLNTNKKRKKYKIHPTDRLGTELPTGPLQDAILRALGR
jgi:tetratricopeptide (TPR) repeat protein